MSLSSAILLDKVRRIVNPTHPNHAYPTSIVDAIARWTDAYDTYAADVKDVSGDAPASVSPSGFASSISPGFYSWTSTAMRNAFVAGFLSYWTGGSFELGILISGTGTGPCPNTGSGTLIFSLEQSSDVSNVNTSTWHSGLLPVFNDLTYDGAAKAQDITDVLHAGTLADIYVLISGLDTTPPPTGPLPVFNTCKVF